MARVAGRLGTLDVDDGGGFVSIGDVVDMTLNLEYGEIDNTAHDDTTRTFIPERSSGTVDFTLRWDDADAGGEDVKAAFLAGSDVSWRYRVEALSGADEYTFNGFVTSMSPTSPNDDSSDVSFTVRISGAVTRGTQA